MIFVTIPHAVGSSPRECWHQQGNVRKKAYAYYPWLQQSPEGCKKMFSTDSKKECVHKAQTVCHILKEYRDSRLIVFSINCFILLGNVAPFSETVFPSISQHVSHSNSSVSSKEPIQKSHWIIKGEITKRSTFNTFFNPTENTLVLPKNNLFLRFWNFYFLSSWTSVCTWRYSVTSDFTNVVLFHRNIVLVCSLRIENFFCKWPDSRYVKPYVQLSVCCNYLTLPL